MLILLAILILFCVVLVTIKLYLNSIKGVCKCKNRLDGKTVIVTGANSGIGYWTAIGLAKRGARLIITSENETDLIRARDDIIKASGNENVTAKHLDLSSFCVVRSFVKDIYETEKRLDVLINNAGTVGVGNKRTEDGLLVGLQINYFGSFLLTHLLIDLLKKTKTARIINVASIMSQFAVVNLDDINKCPGPVHSDTIIYSNSKLFVVYMTWQFAARLRGTGITVNCLHPGAVNTAIFHKRSPFNWHSLVAKVFGWAYFKSPEEGAQTSIHLAVSDKVTNVTGHYYQNCKPSRPLIKKDLQTMQTVWNESIRLVRLKSQEIKV